MFTRISCLSVGLIACLASPAAAQLPATVQLPSFSYFGVDTSVSVPDRGSMSLGGVGRSSMGSTAFGPVLGPRSRSFCRQMSASSTTVHATIHDFDATDRQLLDRQLLDRQLLDQAQRSYGKSPRAATRTSAGEASSAAAGPAGSVAEARRMYAAERSAQERDAVKYMDEAERAAARGKPQVARVLYQMAERRASGELKAEIRERLIALKPAAK